MKNKKITDFLIDCYFNVMIKVINSLEHLSLSYNQKAQAIKNNKFQSIRNHVYQDICTF